MITKVNSGERGKLCELELEDKLNQINKRKGFKLVYDRLQKNKISLVGHNMLLDTLFLVSNLGESLPNSLKELKQLFRTKYGR